jgi:tyrosine-protein kinase Etk/Wzc
MEFGKKSTPKNINQAGKKDFKEIFALFARYWYLFLISVIICGGIGVIYALFSAPVYKINSTITIDDQTNPKSSKSDENSPLDYSDALESPNNANNEIDILKSNFLLTQVAKKMNLNITIYRKQAIGSIELYDDAPFNVQVIAHTDSLQFQKFNIKPINNLIAVTGGLSDINNVIKYGQTLKCGQFDLIFTKNPGVAIDPNGYKITVQSIDGKVEALAKSLTVDLTDKKSTSVALTLEYPNPRKGEVVLQTLMDLYLQSNLENKNRMADSSLAFIDNRLKLVSGQLANVETQFTNFKQENDIADADQQSQSLVSNVSDNSNKLNDQSVQLEILEDISKYINNPENKRLIPSSLAIQDPVFSNSVNSYNQLLNQRGQLSLSYKDSNPIMENLDAQIETARQNLLKSFNTYKKSLSISVDALKGQSTTLNTQVKGVPKKQMALLDYSRQQNLKQELYLYLLQKREEIAIAKTSNISTVRIIDPAKSDYEPFKPNRILAIALGLFIGLLIPRGYLFSMEWLNNRILNKNDILNYTNLPIIGEIDSNDQDKILVIEKKSRSGIVEQFRALRTELLFKLNPEKSNIILLTSSMGGEGKSFITLNLASVISLSGKKVVMLELDLRKPKLAKNLNVEYKLGFSDYIENEKLTIKDILNPTDFSANVFLVPAGNNQGDPSELLLNNRLKLLIEQLKVDFDYILIDSPPVGLVSDSLIIEKFADITLYVARQGFTYKSQLTIINDLISDGKIKKAYLIINDIKNHRKGYYGYDDARKYGYGYNYSE